MILPVIQIVLTVVYEFINLSIKIAHQLLSMQKSLFLKSLFIHSYPLKVNLFHLIVILIHDIFVIILLEVDLYGLELFLELKLGRIYLYYNFMNFYDLKREY